MPDRQRIEARLEALWEIARGPNGGADRPAFSAAEAQAMLLVAGWAVKDGLEPGVDRWGNLWALPPGAEGRLLTAGSHVDTVPDGGRYDGALGTVLGLELAAELGRDGGILVCAAEEAPRFGAGTIGSRLLAGSLRETELGELGEGGSGVTAAEARASYLEALSTLPRIEPPLERWGAHAEIHVAQRRSLRTLGVVRRVASPRRFEAVITGSAGHAGEVAMEERRDALAAAAELVLAVESAARAAEPETVATVGVLSVQPGAVSVIPAATRLSIDARGISGPSVDRLEAAIREAGTEIAARRGIELELRRVRAGEPVELHRGLAAAALAAAERLGIAAAETWSGAGHDAQHLAALVPTLLLFVPLHGGESHTPDEGADLDECLAAAAVAGAVLSGL